jgi:Family of unknown function (DUF6445)
MYPIVVDNFFEDPNSIRNYAMKLQYKFANLDNDGWLGYRCFTIDQNLTKKITEKIHQLIPTSSYIDTFNYYFHYSLKKTKQTSPYNFHEYKIHCDSCDFAGLVYLYPNPPEKMGTSFYTDKKKYFSSVENKYNRLIYYPGTMWHGPTDLFGDMKENARLTLTFFSNTSKK